MFLLYGDSPMTDGEMLIRRSYGGDQPTVGLHMPAEPHAHRKGPPVGNHIRSPWVCWHFRGGGRHSSPSYAVNSSHTVLGTSRASANAQVAQLWTATDAPDTVWGELSGNGQ